MRDTAPRGMIMADKALPARNPDPDDCKYAKSQMSPPLHCTPPDAAAAINAKTAAKKGTTRIPIKQSHSTRKAPPEADTQETATQADTDARPGRGNINKKLRPRADTTQLSGT